MKDHFIRILSISRLILILVLLGLFFLSNNSAFAIDNNSTDDETINDATSSENPSEWTPKYFQEKVEGLEEEIAFLHEQQNSLWDRLERGVTVNLYATLEYENFGNSRSSFDARNIELFVDARVTPRLRGFAEIEYERTAITSTGNRQGEVEVEQGWMEYKIKDYFSPRFGVVLVPFGNFNLLHFDPVRDLTDRPIAMRRVIPVTWAEAGAGFVGNFSLNKLSDSRLLSDATVNYQVYFVNGLTNRVTDRGLRSARGAFGSDNNGNKALTGRLALSPLEGQEIAVSGYYGEYDAAGREITGINVDFSLSKGPFQLIGEYAIFDLESGGVQPGTPSQLVSDRLEGGYIQANYHFWFDFLNDTFLGDKFPSPTFTAVLRYGGAVVNDDGDTGTGENREDRITVGMNYRPIENFVFKMEYQFNNTKNEALERGDQDGFIASVTAAF